MDTFLNAHTVLTGWTAPEAPVVLQPCCT